MEKYFLYLPVYYAIYKDLYDFTKDPSNNYNYTLLQADKPDNAVKTDKAVFECLVKRSSEEPESAVFAIGDPRSIALKPNWATSPVRLIGALITGSPFWAIDHGKCETLTINDLCKFDSIVSYTPGTTSYDLVCSVLRDNGISLSKLDPVPAKTEIPKFLEPSAPGGNNNQTITITPDIIGIVDTNASRDYDIVEYSVGSDHNLSYLLITALATTQDTIYKHPELVMAFIKSVQRAINELHARNPEIIRYAATVFTKNDEAKVLKALELADQSHVYPHDIGINEVLWLNAVTRAIRADGEQVTENSLKRSKEVYSLIGKSNEQLVRSALNELKSEGNTLKAHEDTPWIHKYDTMGVISIISLLAFVALRLSIEYNILAVIIGLPVLCYLLGHYFVIPRFRHSLQMRLGWWATSGLIFALIVNHFCSAEKVKTNDIFYVLLGVSLALFLASAVTKYQKK
jgi:hypothetical protein